MKINECLYKNKTIVLTNCFYDKDLKQLNILKNSLEEIEKKYENFILINLNPLICPKKINKCSYFNESNTLIFMDDNHLSRDFTLKLSNYLSDILIE